MIKHQLSYSGLVEYISRKLKESENEAIKSAQAFQRNLGLDSVKLINNARRYLDEIKTV